MLNRLLRAEKLRAFVFIVAGLSLSAGVAYADTAMSPAGRNSSPVGCHSRVGNDSQPVGEQSHACPVFVDGVYGVRGPKAGGNEFYVYGKNLNKVAGILIHGKIARIDYRNPTFISAIAPASKTTGSYKIQFVTKGGNLASDGNFKYTYTK